MRIKPTYLAFFASLLFNLYGIPGHIEDAKQWEWWVRMAPPDYPWIFHLLVTLGGLALLYAVFPTMWRVVRNIGPNSTKPSSKRGAQAEERIYTERTAGELFSALPHLTSVRAEQYLQPHIGKWMPVQSTIVDISEDGEHIHVILGEKFGPYIAARFGKKLWAAHLETMDRGDRLSVEGRIHQMDMMQMHLVNCEIIARKEHDDTLRHSSTGSLN